MAERYRPASYHRVVTIALLLVNAIAIAYAIVEGGAGRWDYHFRDGASFITWLGSAQMLGAALLFVACYYSGTIIRLEGEPERANAGWLVFALGFFVLAIDQQFRLREYLTYLIDGAWPTHAHPSSTTGVLKALAAAAAIGLVVYYRALVLSNFRMVMTFIAGFWFLLIMLLVNMLVDALGLPSWLGKVLEGSGKLLALAMFLSGSYIALLDRLWAANAAAQLGLYGERRQRQIPISFPDRRGRVEFGPLAPSEAGVAEGAAPAERTPTEPEVETPTATPEAAAPAEPGPAETTAEATPEEAKPAEPSPAEAKPAEAKPVEAKPEEAKPEEAKPAEPSPAEAKPADAKPAEAKPAEAKPAEAKPAEAKAEARPAEARPAEATEAKPPAAEPKA
jgi:hypothetical protein